MIDKYTLSDVTLLTVAQNPYPTLIRFSVTLHDTEMGPIVTISGCLIGDHGIVRAPKTFAARGTYDTGVVTFADWFIEELNAEWKLNPVLVRLLAKLQKPYQDRVPEIQDIEIVRRAGSKS